MKYEYIAGKNVKAVFEDTIGAISLYSDGGELYHDWLVKCGIKRGDIRFIHVAKGKVYLPEDSRGLDTQHLTWFEKYNYMFARLNRLEEIDMTGFDASNVKTMDFLFNNCPRLKKIQMNGLNTANVESMRSMFEGCRGLKTLDLSLINTEKTTDMMWMFRGCTSLKNLNLKNFNTTRVTTMLGMFDDCAALTDLDLSSFDMSSVKDARGMFAGCEGLRTITAQPMINGHTMTDRMFQHCAKDLLIKTKEDVEA